MTEMPQDSPSPEGEGPICSHCLRPGTIIQHQGRHWCNWCDDWADIQPSMPVIVCERKNFLHVLLSPWGFFNLTLAPCTLGLTLLIVAGMHFLAMPRRVWLEGSRLFSDKSLPADGVKLRDIHLEIGHQTLLGVTANRYLRINYWNERGKKRYLNLNQIYYGRDALDRVIALVSKQEGDAAYVLTFRTP